MKGAKNIPYIDGLHLFDPFGFSIYNFKVDLGFKMIVKREIM